MVMNTDLHRQITYGKQGHFIGRRLIPGNTGGRGGDEGNTLTQLTFNWVYRTREPIRKNVTFTKL